MFELLITTTLHILDSIYFSTAQEKGIFCFASVAQLKVSLYIQN